KPKVKTKWISLKRLKIHEFNTTIRRMHPDERQWVRAYSLLGELESRAIVQFSKQSGKLFLAYLALTSLRNGNSLSISAFKIDASVPVAYAFTATSFLFVFIALSFNHLSTITSLRLKKGIKLNIPGFSVEIFRLLNNQSEYALGVSIFQSSFIKERFPISKLLGVALLFILLAASIPYFAFGWYVFHEQLLISLSPSFSTAERAASAFGALTIPFAFAYAFLFHIPLPTKKNDFSIRWGVLVYLDPPGKHPRIAEWLEENK
ncbi:MAG: hypothetical protein P8X51_08860, partial [Maritimibacter sp.]